MKHVKYAIIPALLLLLATVIVAISLILKRSEKTTLQGVTMCREYSAASKISGRIERVYVSEGERVDSGAMLFALTTPELDAKLSQALAANRAAEALNSEVRAGARPQQIEAAYNLWQRATAAQTLAHQTFTRISKLHDKGVVTTQQLDEARANLEAATASQSAAYAEYNLALEGATKEQKSASKARTQMAQSAVNEVETYIADSRVYAPVSGTISTIAHYAGEVVAAGFPVVALLDTSDIWVEFNIRETLMPKIKHGSRFSAYIPALDQHIILTVSNIAPQADFATWSATRNDKGFDIRTFAVKMRPTEACELQRGMSAIITLE